MIIAGPILMGTPPPRPLTDQRGTGGSRPDEAGQQMTDFSCSQSNKRLRRQRRWGSRWSRQRRALVHANPDQEGIGQHDEGEMAIPADIAADFILIEPQVFGGLQIFFDRPAGANSLHDG